ncbi:sigma-70 family RNA polymerase sigma factor [Bernardetia sp. ABR2-2B]|uniref:RNA polymerase sigma factor n=1 Tax=Bernardetia sp. ABR2-2B TaxID=3127472 RepID=UPI0030CE3D25
MSEKEIFSGCLKGSRPAQEALYRLYAGKVMTTCIRYAKSREEAEDMLQEVFLIIFKKINQVKKFEALGGWIRQVAVHKAIDIYHKQKKHFGHLSDEALMYESDTKDTALDMLSAEELIKLIRELPQGYRVVFNLYIIEGYKHEDIGKLLGISESTSRSQLTKAKQALRKILATNYKITQYIR